MRNCHGGTSVMIPKKSIHFANCELKARLSSIAAAAEL